MSIGRRFVNLVRSNLGSLLDRFPGEDRTGHTPIEDLTDADLEKEIQRRRQRREAAERAATSPPAEDVWSEVERAAREGSGSYRSNSRRNAGSYRRPGSSPGPSNRPSNTSQPGRDPRLAQLYAQLECPYGANITTVRKHYRALMLKYHPDMHSGNPEKQRLATDLSQRLTMAYNELRRVLTA